MRMNIKTPNRKHHSETELAELSTQEQQQNATFGSPHNFDGVQNRFRHVPRGSKQRCQSTYDDAELQNITGFNSRSL